MNRFRQQILNDYPQVENVIVFYEAHGNYRYSIHSRKENLDRFYVRASEEIKGYDNFSTGGHKSRGGGGINSIDSDVCHSFVKEIVNCLSKN